MRYINTTPFPTLCFESTGPDGPIHTVVVRATTVIVPGGILSLADEQIPLNFTDRYFGKPGASSLKYPNDLAPYKPKTDIILIATAYPPPKSAEAWIVGVRMGPHAKSFVVTGPRCWKKSFLLGWQPTPLTAAPPQPMRYECAFGGTLSQNDGNGQSRIIDACPDNPVGKGWVSPLAARLQPDVETHPVPQFFSSRADLPPVFGKKFAVEGFGAIAPSWASRQQYAGAWPAAPGEEAPASNDFDYLFYNCAHPDLIVPYLEGDEVVQLFNLTPVGTLDFQLPGHRIVVAARGVMEEPVVSIKAVLDTVIIEPDEMRATLVWRATVRCEAGFESLEAQLMWRQQEADVAVRHDI